MVFFEYYDKIKLSDKFVYLTNIKSFRRNETLRCNSPDLEKFLNLMKCFPELELCNHVFTLSC